jgi:hypothetical protein
MFAGTFDVSIYEFFNDREILFECTKISSRKVACDGEKAWGADYQVTQSPTWWRLKMNLSWRASRYWRIDCGSFMAISGLM